MTFEVVELPRRYKALGRKKSLKRTRLGKATKRPATGKIKRSRNKPKGVSKLVKELDTVFSRWVRVSHAKEEICTCYTCGHQLHWKKIHAGHYISRFYKATRWDERQVLPQCAMCNLWKRGDPTTFRENLVRDLGEETVREIESSRKTLTKLDRSFLEERISHYQQALKGLSTGE